MDLFFIFVTFNLPARLQFCYSSNRSFLTVILKAAPHCLHFTMRACFLAGACLRRTALNSLVRNVIARSCRCLRALFWMPFRRGFLQTLRPSVTSKTSEGFVNVGSLTGAYSYAHIASLTVLISAGVGGSFTGVVSERGRHFWADAAGASCLALVNCSTHL